MPETAYDRWITSTLPEAYFASLEEQPEEEPDEFEPDYLWDEDEQ